MNPFIDPAEFAMLMNNGYFGVSEDKLTEIAKTMYYSGLGLEEAAWECDIDPANLSNRDIHKIRLYFEELSGEV